ncbi:MAG: hypothetical protein JO340_21630 [Acidobacteriaceae bacterium]|nr:hypothetical protein [Acidobacteriaceae bacterium]
MSRCGGLIVCSVLLVSSAWAADDQALWREYGLAHTEATQAGKLKVTTYRMKDLTGALAAWEWLRPEGSRACELAAFCTENSGRVTVWDDNYVVTFEGGAPTKALVDEILKGLADKRDTALPAIFTFLPHEGLAPESARYVLGPESLKAFAPELAAANPGFNDGAEAQVADYKVGGASRVHLALFYYLTPEMARIHSAGFRGVANAHVKRSGMLVAVVFGPATETQADTLLSRVQYEAKITWNDTPPPSPIKPLYQLLLNIMYLSILLAALCLVAGLIYAGMRVYRRRYGTLDEAEAMTTLHLTGDQQSTR